MIFRPSFSSSSDSPAWHDDDDDDVSFHFECCLFCIFVSGIVACLLFFLLFALAAAVRFSWVFS